jgi:hypothetical protein
VTPYDLNIPETERIGQLVADCPESQNERVRDNLDNYLEPGIPWVTTPHEDPLIRLPMTSDSLWEQARTSRAGSLMLAACQEGYALLSDMEERSMIESR